MSTDKEPASDEMLRSLAHRGPYAHSLSAPEAETINWLASRELHRRAQPPYAGTLPPLQELARQSIEPVNWHIAEHDGAKIFERLVLRENLPDGGQRLHVYRVIGRALMAMYDVFELPAGATTASASAADLKPAWPPGRDYNRE